MKSAYTPSETRADAVIHILGVTLALGGAGWLFQRLAGGPWNATFAFGFYAVALIGVLGVSAAYNLTTGPIKDRLRRLDHAMIFVMIAATYTPFILLRLPPETGIALGIGVGGGCMCGILLKLLLPGRFDRLSVLLYLGMGWAIAWTLEPLRASIGALSLQLLLAGGLLYTLGVPFCLMERLRFHNALWHACVLAGATVHFATMVVEFT